MITAIGAFDGYHRAHQMLLEKASSMSGSGGWGVLTFSRDDGLLLRRKGSVALFSSAEQRTIERYLKIPTVIKVDFTEQIEAMEPCEFIDHIVERGVSGCVVGDGFRFGRGRSGDAELLRRECDKRGLAFAAIPTQHMSDGTEISSSAVRVAITSGDPRSADEMLGHPFFLTGVVVRGEERGRLLGYPTANIDLDDSKVALPNGVYTSLIFARGEWYRGAANIGVNPTFGDIDRARLEVHLNGFSGDLYGQTISVFFVDRIRSEKHFSSKDELARQIRSDASSADERAASYAERSSAMMSEFARAFVL